MHHGEAFFEALFGFKEVDYLSTRHQLFQKCSFEVQRRCSLAGTQRVHKERAVFAHPSLDKNHRISSGWHSTPSVAELRAETADLVRTFEHQHPGVLSALRQMPPTSDDALKASAVRAISPESPMAPWVLCSHITGESGALHCRFPNAFFQVASQFNALEFISPSVTPEDGVTHYVHDRTQGPACALACMAGTAYRNYLLHPALFKAGGEEERDIGEHLRGQQASHQVSLLDDFTAYLTAAHGPDAEPAHAVADVGFEHFYRIVNGYYDPSPRMAAFDSRLKELARRYNSTPAEVESVLEARLRVCLVEDATVTLPLHTSRRGGPSVSDVHEVSQSYNSAVSLPPTDTWAPSERAGVEAMARLVLRGTYEATLLAGVQHTLRCLGKQGNTASPLSSSFDVVPFVLPPIFLTKVGGGVFNNEAAWIAAAIESAVHRVSALGVPLDIRLVHYREVEPFYLARFPAWPIRSSS